MFLEDNEILSSENQVRTSVSKNFQKKEFEKFRNFLEEILGLDEFLHNFEKDIPFSLFSKKYFEKKSYLLLRKRSQNPRKKAPDPVKRVIIIKKFNFEKKKEEQKLFSRDSEM
jgi:hypothetical protein